MYYIHEGSWINECVFIYRTYYIMSHSGLQYYSIGWDRTPACEGASGCRYQSIFDLTYPPNPCMKCEMKLETTTPGTRCPALFDKGVGCLTSPANHVTMKMQETGPTVYRPYPRRLECLTICRHNYKGSTFSSVILRPWVLVRSGARTLDLPHSRLALHQLTRRRRFIHSLLHANIHDPHLLKKCSIGQ